MWPETLLQWVDLALFSSSLLLSTASLVFGLLFWILIPKFRKFTNYLFLNILILSAIVCISCYILYNVQLPRLHFNDYEKNVIVIIIFVLSRLMMCHWMLLNSFYHYLKIVKMYNSNIKKKYFVAHVSATLIPIVEVFILFLFAYFLPLSEIKVEYVTNILVGLILIPNSLIHLKILYTLLKLACREDRNDLFTPSIVTSGVSLIPIFLLVFFSNKYDELVRNNMRIVSVVNIASVVMFLSMKKHREVWAWYQERRRRIAQRIGEPEINANRATDNIKMDTVNQINDVQL